MSQKHSFLAKALKASLQVEKKSFRTLEAKEEGNGIHIYVIHNPNSGNANAFWLIATIILWEQKDPQTWGHYTEQMKHSVILTMTWESYQVYAPPRVPA